MATSPSYREKAIKGLLDRIEYAAKHDRMDEELEHLEHLARIIEIKLGKYATEDQINEFYKNLAKEFKKQRLSD